jgi:hypothetical protein
MKDILVAALSPDPDIELRNEIYNLNEALDIAKDYLIDQCDCLDRTCKACVVYRNMDRELLGDE